MGTADFFGVLPYMGSTILSIVLGTPFARSIMGFLGYPSRAINFDIECDVGMEG